MPPDTRFVCFEIDEWKALCLSNGFIGRLRTYVQPSFDVKLVKMDEVTEISLPKSDMMDWVHAAVKLGFRPQSPAEQKLLAGICH